MPGSGEQMIIVTVNDRMCIQKEYPGIVADMQ
jgi:hypothetical protein